MKRRIVFMVMLIGLTGCGVGSSDNVSVSGGDIKYTKDTRTGFCFAYVGSSKATSFEITGLGIANVDCLKIPGRLME